MDIGDRPSRDLIPPDLRLVSEAAAALCLREFDLFRAAWQHWFGQAPEDKAVEQAFVVRLDPGRLLLLPEAARHGVLKWHTASARAAWPVRVLLFRSVLSF